MEYFCPVTKEKLQITPSGLAREDGAIYRYAYMGPSPIPNFVLDGISSDESNSLSYDMPLSTEIYRNFLDWLFATFDEDELAFRKKLVSHMKLSKGQRVLVTSCGLGEDLPIIAEEIGPNGVLYAQDLSTSMVFAAHKKFSTNCKILTPNFSIGNALSLPFKDNYFDSVFHFGGINFFGDMSQSIKEMARVTKIGGRVVFGDESVAPWLRNTEYGKISIANNRLWESPLPLHNLPANCEDVNCTWVLGNCFYLIDFKVLEILPYMNIDIPHKGTRGGSARTRYFGNLEGVSESVKKLAQSEAQKEGLSLHDWLEKAISNAVR